MKDGDRLKDLGIDGGVILKELMTNQNMSAGLGCERGGSGKLF
jgi:hypothetical protein